MNMSVGNIKLYTTYGPWDWCCTHGEYFLTNNKKKHDKKFIIEVNDINIPEEAEQINIKGSETNFVHHYNVHKKLGKNYESIFEYCEYGDKSFNVLFGYRSVPTPEQCKQLIGGKFNVLYQRNIKRPDNIKIIDEESCPICYENMDEPFIGKCGHQFHYDCLWKYAEHNGYITNTKCHNICKHNKRITKMNCPMCCVIII